MARLLYVAYDLSTRRHLYRYRKTLDKTQWMKKRELRRLQIEKLRFLLSQAYDNVPYYHESFEKNGFHPSDFKDLGDLGKIPVLRRSDLQSRSSDLVSRDAKKLRLVARQTSGTTATPVRIYRSNTDFTWDLAAELRGFSWAGFETGSKLVYLRLFEPHHDELAGLKHRFRRFVIRWKLLGGYDLSTKSIASFCLRNRNFKPDYVMGGAGPVNIFACFLSENRQFAVHPKGVFTYAETLLPHYRRTIEQAFDCKVYDWYGSTELDSIAHQCGQHEGHHITEENVFLEVERDGEPAAPGEEGRVLLTNLNNFAMPLIRYDIGDLGKMLDDHCSCGRDLSLFTPIGRTYEYFVHSDGTFTFFRDLRTVFEDLPIEDFQIVQESPDEIVVRIVKKQGYTDAHTEFIRKNSTFMMSRVVKMKVEAMDSVPLTGFGKVPHFVSKIHTRYT